MARATVGAVAAASTLIWRRRMDEMSGVSQTVDAAEGMWRMMLDSTCDAAAAADISRDDSWAPRC